MPYFKRTDIFKVFGIALLSMTSAFAEDGKLSTLLGRSPSQVNAMSYLNLNSLGALLSEEDIRLNVPDNISEVWLVSDLNVDTLRPNWEAGYAITSADVDAEGLVKAVGGFVDQLGGTEVVRSAKQSYLLPLADRRIGFLRPANRAMLADWLSDEGAGKIPPYLAEQAKQPEQYLSLFLALELRDMFSPVAVEQNLDSFSSTSGKDVAAIAPVLASIKGASIIVGRRSLDECIVSFEFAKSPESLSGIMPALLAEVLDRNGTAAPEVSEWRVKVEGTRLAMQGRIESATLDGLLGIFSVQQHAEHVTRSVASSVTSEGSESRTGNVSKEYFDRVTGLIERVRRYSAQTTGSRAKWNEQQARRIEELGTLNVDPKLVDYGADVAGILRNNSVAIQRGNVAAGQLSAAQAQSFGYGGDYYGGYYSARSPRSASRGASLTQSQQRMAGFGSYREAIAEIDRRTAEIRREMTQKYGIQF